MDFTNWVSGWRSKGTQGFTEDMGGSKKMKAAQQNGILKRGHAMRVIFFYPGEEGTYVDNAEVTLFDNGIVHITSNQEETTTHLQNCEILWRFETDAEDRANKVRLLKPKSESRSASDDGERPEPTPGKKGPSKEIQ